LKNNWLDVDMIAGAVKGYNAILVIAKRREGEVYGF